MLKKEDYKIDKTNRYLNLDHELEQMESVKQSILNGDIYATVNSVSRSGMSRRISFYRAIKTNYTGEEKLVIERVTHCIAWLTGWEPIGKYTSHGKSMQDAGLQVSGCGMDMIFLTLYNCMPYEEAKDWSQRYNTL